MSKVTSTVVNCEGEGHCWHEGTAVGSFYCCKCGNYDSLGTYFVDNPYLVALTARGLEDIASGRVNKIPNIRKARG